MPDLTVPQLQARVDDWIKTVGVRYFSEMTNLAILMEEVGELARLFARRYGEQSSKSTDLDRDIADELSDVLWVVVCLANQTGVDLSKSFEANMAKKSARDATRHKDNPKLA